ncbi:hypothetical protein M408DRAFT_328377 [Serendipita vermifera MAFF 305830]|uniref:Uncharacterized protein n=1 Tax=Serendipita vermifera MAFF 305830 TaxID=933852 RepID=A0A0C2WUP2_SERVB|nr:hypothetical protein M408DRAFT_328377 [Serendipita vermifera MAFF 305830]
MRQHYGALAVISIGGMSDEETDDEETNIRGQRVLGVRRLAFRSDAYTNASHYLDAVAHSHLHSRTFHPYSRPGPTPRKPRVQKTTVGRSDPPMWSPPEFYSDTFIKQATDSNMLKVLNRGASIPNPLPTIEDYNRWAMEGDISLAEAWNAHKSDCVTCGRDMDMS